MWTEAIGFSHTFAIISGTNECYSAENHNLKVADNLLQINFGGAKSKQAIIMWCCLGSRRFACQLFISSFFKDN
jgi:hypothetical protein